MITIRIAELNIGIKSRYPETEKYCREYMVGQKVPDFVVEPSEEEVRQEMKLTPVIRDPGEAEFICVYRQIGYRLLDYDAMIMHAVVMDLDGTGIAILAPSGTGKSTLALHILDRYEGKARIINGDKPIVRFSGNKLYAYGTPWNGKEEFGCNDRVELKKLCFLERGETDEVRRADEKETAELLFRQLLIPGETEQVIRFMDLSERILDVTEWYQIRCTEHDSAATTTTQGVLN